MVVLWRLKPSLGFVLTCLILSKVDGDHKLVGKSDFCLWPESIAPYNYQGKAVCIHQESSSCLHILIASGPRYLWQISVIYRVNCQCNQQKRKNQLDITTSRANRVLFGPGISGTLGIAFFSVTTAWTCPDSNPKGTNTGSRESCWTPRFFRFHICAKWACTTLLPCKHVYLLIL